MKQFIYIPFLLILLVSACHRREVAPIYVLGESGIQATGAYLTTDQQGNPVLCWTEQDRKDSLNRLKYAVYDRQQQKFSDAITVTTSAGCSTAAESMGKVAFKSDGTVIALFAKKFSGEKNPYAGAICYSISPDGKNWSVANYLHSDTAHAYGRSFFDIERLRDGELAAVWLDGRFGKAIKGSALFFNRTSKGKGFGADTCLDKGTCECCRTDLLSDDQGGLHLAYRSIQIPDMLSGRQVRDMVYKFSADDGRTFSAARPISRDNWEISGCPHTGPSLAMLGRSAGVTWFTAGGGAPGLYCTTALPGAGFKNRKLVTATGKHPQMITLPEGHTLMVCEEPVEETAATQAHQPSESMEMDHSKGQIMQHGPAGSAKIVLYRMSGGQAAGNIVLTDGKQADHHAVLAGIGNQLVAAWVREEKGRSEIAYMTIQPQWDE